MHIRANGIDIAYEESGDPAAPAVLLIMGLGTQLTRWPPLLVEALDAQGLRTIRYDNRDVGLSTRLEDAGLPDILALMTGQGAPPPYTLDDMADDAVALLDALGIARAHIVGASMGGMIAQLVAARHPDRVLSLTSIMSSSGNPAIPRGSDAALAALAGPRPDPADEEAVVARAVTVGELLGSPGYPIDRARREAAARDDYRRGYYPAGAVRHTAAVLAGGDRRPLLARIVAPTLVIHGVDDPLVPVAAGRDTAANIPGAELLELPGMGHDTPDALVPAIASAILALVARSTGGVAAHPRVDRGDDSGS